MTDIYQTSYCPLAKLCGLSCRRGIENLKVVYSKEIIPIKILMMTYKTPAKAGWQHIFVPSVAGLMIASELVRDIINGEMGIALYEMLNNHACRSAVHGVSI